MYMINRLMDEVIKNNNIISYINLDMQNKYKGWTNNFSLYTENGEILNLDLMKENDLFLLFVLASIWSRTGPWENAAYFIAYLKAEGLDNPLRWLDKDLVENERFNRELNTAKIQGIYKGIKARKKISFRKDNYDSMYVISEHWNEIKIVLHQANVNNNYISFIHYMRNLKGLGSNGKSMNIKILLILRELRCQGIYTNIPGELCCVPDERVKEACKDLGIKIPRNLSTVKDLVKASSVLYSHFGDLYDIPAFAYYDLKEKLN